MATKTESVSDIYQIKVILLGTKPPIWCRLLVPADMPQAQLHNALQIAMGWQNCHMHEFQIGRRYFGKPSPEEGLMGVTPTEDEREVHFSSVLGRVGAKMIYTYDMGDSWEHSIVLEKQLPMDPSMKHPACVDGQLACRRKTAAASPGTTTCWKPSPIAAIQNMKN